MFRRKRLWSISGLLLLISSCDLPMPNGMRSPEPVIVDMPQSINDHSWEKDTSIYLLHLSKDKITFSHALKQIEMSDWNQLDSLLKKSASAMQEEKVVLKVDSLAYKRIDSLLDILKENKINQFMLVTDLEMDPG